MRVFPILSAIGAALLLQACGASESRQPDAAARPVRLMVVGAKQPLESRRYVGRVDAVSTVDLSFQVGGRLSELPVQQGSVVPRGELIAALDPADYQLAVREAEVQAEQSRRELERYQTLLARGTVSASEFDQLQTRHQLAQVALDNARRNLAYTRIEAPFDALITRRQLDAHSNVQPNATVVRVQDVSELRVHISAPEQLVRLADDRDQYQVSAHFPQLPDHSFPLEYREHETEPGAVAQTYRISFGMPRPEGLNLLPGMTVSVEISAREAGRRSGFPVPLAALDTNADGSFRAWVYDPREGTVSPRPVQVGKLSGEHANVVDGLRAGDTIVTAGAMFLREGMPVRPFEQF